jgi:hypothetical protein
LLVNVTTMGGLVLPMPWFPKARVVSETVACATPVPVRLTVCGLLLAESVIVSEAVFAPVVAGVKTTLIVHDV